MNNEGAKNVSWARLSPFRGWVSLTMAFTGKFVNIQLIISFGCGSIPLTLVLIGRGGSLSILCHGCGFACQQRVLKTFPGRGYLRFEDGVVWQWHLLVNLYIYYIIYYIYIIYIYIYIIILSKRHIFILYLYTFILQRDYYRANLKLRLLQEQNNKKMEIL